MNYRCHNFRIFTILLFCFLVYNNHAQIELGLITLTDEVEDGYTLFKEPGNGTGPTDFFLINNCGQIINTWDGPNDLFRHPKILPNGNLMFIMGNTIYEKNWDNEYVNEIELQVPGTNLDYEIIKLENGNYLSIGRKNFSEQEFLDLGFNLGINSPFVVDVVMELDSSTAEVLWEWDISNHTIQDRDSTLSNFGVIADHPEKLDINAISTFDWTFEESFMINGFDYNPELEQIMLSVRKMSEVIIIDRSTTTEEAAGSSGGNSGMGGDILFRWGNPANYGAGTESERRLYFQHNPKWITQGVHRGKIAMFNNGLDRDFIGPLFSEAPVVDTNVDAMGNYSLDSEGQFSSGEAFTYYRPTDPLNYFYSSYLSGVEMMPNGNAFFTVGETDELIEVTLEGEIAWQFNLPFTGFRCEKYPADYPAFANVDLIPGEFLPYTSENFNCIVSNTEEVGLSEIDIVHLQNHTIEIRNSELDVLSYTLLDGHGRILNDKRSSESLVTIELAHLYAGFYILHVMNPATGDYTNHRFVQTQQ